jgi:hypothetical protein
MSEKTNNPQLDGELKQGGIIKKMPIFLNVGGGEKEVWVTYEVEPEEAIGTCSVCKKENQKIVKEKIKGDPKVDSDDQAVIAEAQEEIKKLADRVEEKMFICKDCFNDDFISQRPQKYIQAMEEASKELGIKIDSEGLRKAVMGVE